MAQQKDGEGVFGETFEGAAEVARPISVKLVVEVLRGVAQVDLMPSAVCGLLFAAAVTPARGAMSAPFGGHAFTWPFVLTTMLFLAAVPAIPRLRRV
ncbi:hypothetical protein [Kitasatospora sp. NPDC056531]|uniref:hypothetical protein n=1 Tax=Kitasatospora sp. NPDC056531 TaxID=3345856 RepID=UPI0036969F26